MPRLPNGSLLGVVLTFATLYASSAHAGFDACNGVRVEVEANCRWEVQEVCRERCQTVEVSRVCATREYRRCSQTCTFEEDAGCTTDCNVICEDQCSQGLDIVCQHNCFPECTENCDMKCAGFADEVECRASCEATCDGECNVQCAALPPEANCYNHCLECCSGTCVAVANFDCQFDCQMVEYESCEVETRQECGESCGEEGALFCDGQLIAAGGIVTQCASALLAEGIAVAEAEYDVNVDEVVEDAEDVLTEIKDSVNDATDNDESAGANADDQTGEDGTANGCNVSRGAPSLGWVALLGMLVAVGRRRRVETQ